MQWWGLTTLPRLAAVMEEFWMWSGVVVLETFAVPAGLGRLGCLQVGGLRVRLLCGDSQLQLSAGWHV